MTYDNAASRGRNRLTRERIRPDKDPERPEVALARKLIKAEYGLRSGRRDGGGAGPGGAGSVWDQLADDLNRLMDRLRGRTASAGGPPSSFGGQEAGPGQQPTFEQQAQTGRAGFEAMISRLPIRELEAFEDAVLKLVEDKENKKWKKAYDKNPEGMPAVMKYANNAYMRKLVEGASPSVDPPTREQGQPHAEASRARASAKSRDARFLIVGSQEARGAERRRPHEVER